MANECDGEVTIENAMYAISELIRELPGPLADRIAACQIEIHEGKPGDAHAPLGVTPDMAGAFIQPISTEHLDDEVPLSGSVIMLFLKNIEPLTIDEICSTFVHELGHLCGLDEDEVEALGLGRAQALPCV